MHFKTASLRGVVRRFIEYFHHDIEYYNVEAGISHILFLNCFYSFAEQLENERTKSKSTENELEEAKSKKFYLTNDSVE